MSNSTIANDYPPWGFYYKVAFSSSNPKHSWPFNKENDVRFQSVSGLSVEYEVEEYKEGGENRFVHKLPVRTKYADLVLKRGMLIDSDVTKWCLAAFRDRDFRPANISVILMNEKGEPLRTWSIAHAIPKKWLVSDLNANDNAVVIETLELTYQFFTILPSS